MTATNRSATSNYVVASVLSLSVVVFLACCDRAQSTSEIEQRQQALESAVHQPWSELVDDVTMEQTTATPPPAGYDVDEHCPLVYDFSLRWPIRDNLANETVGRFELRASSSAPSAVELRNRATGIYPVHNQRHHPGQEWWQGELDAVEAQLDRRGLATDLPDPWLLARTSLGVDAFFPALPRQGQPRARWSAPFDASDETPPAITELATHIDLDGRTATIFEARHEPADTPAFFGRYVVGHSGRVLAAIWTTPAGDDRVAVASARLTGSCDGVRLPALPSVRKANTEPP